MHEAALTDKNIEIPGEVREKPKENLVMTAELPPCK